MIRLKFLLAILALGSSSLLVQLCHAGRCPLEGKSFSINSKVVVLPNDGHMRQSLLREEYSHDQRRAKISYYVLDDPDGNSGILNGTGTFYTESNRSVTVALEMLTSMAILSSKTELNKYIGLSIPDDMVDPAADDFIIGPARLLFFLNRHRDSQRLADMSNPILVSNVPCLKYNFFYTTKSGEKLKFTLYYSEQALASNVESFPIQVIIEYLDAGRNLLNVMVNYSPWENLGPSSYGMSDSNAHRHVQLDLFTFKPLSGLSIILSAEHGRDLFASRPADKTKFSFKAVVETNYNTYTRFIAYDARLDTLVQRPEWSDKTTSGFTHFSYNFKLNRLYNIVRGAPDSKSLVGRVLHLSKQDSSYDGADGVSEDYQCIVGKVLPNSKMGSPTKPLSISQLLVGSSKFVYLGRALVRGIPSLVYEASDGTSPFWIDQRLVYKNVEGYETDRSLDSGINKPANSTATTTLVYIGDTSVDQPLLMIEIYKLDVSKNTLTEKKTIHLYDFKWELNYDEEPASWFSLQDLCSSGIGKNQYALIKLLLESEATREGGRSGRASEDDSNRPGETFTSQAGTDLALMASIQSNLKIPATMIYDIKSRLSGGVNKAIARSIINERLLLAVSFRVAEHIDNLVELIYLGQGTLSYIKQTGDKRLRIITKARTVAGCFYLASHRRANLFFAFEPKTRTCYINLNPVESDDAEIPPYFMMSPAAFMEVYRVNHIKNSKLDIWSQDIYQTASSSFINSASLVGIKMNLLGVGLNNEDIEFGITQAEVDERNFRTSKASKEVDYEQQILADRFEGVGLAATSALNKRVGSIPMNVNHWSLVGSQVNQETTMTHDQCHAACLGDSGCQSYSVCIQGSEYQCILSKASFKSVHAIEQIMKFSRTIESRVGNMSELDRTFKVELDDDQIVEIIKHPNCELNNVLYVNHFNRPVVTRNTFTNRFIYPAEDQEECAAMCIEQNIQIIREDVEREILTAQSIFDPASPSPEDHEEMRSLLDKHRYATKQVCRAFFYLNKARMLSFPRDLADRIQESAVDYKSNRGTDHQIGLTNTDNGYCLMIEPARRKDAQDAHETDQSTRVANEYIEMEMYSFKFDLFYEKQYGVRLLGSKMDGIELEAQKLATMNGRDINENHFSALKAFVQRGENSQDMIHASVTKCAAVCFLQTWGPWPACRSFDIVMETLNYQYVLRCYLNSITLKQAITTQRLDLIDDSREPQAWHYEPRDGFVLDESNLDAKFQLVETSLELIDQLSTVRLHSFIAFLIGLVAVIGGLLVGLQMGQKYLSRKLRARTNVDMLVTPQIHLEFSDQANLD